MADGVPAAELFDTPGMEDAIALLEFIDDLVDPGERVDGPERVARFLARDEAAGRFEFQLVKDYRAGGRPQVVYANRTLCFACHQNGAPIFSRALWDETNANPQTAALLAASGHHFYGIPDKLFTDLIADDTGYLAWPVERRGEAPAPWRWFAVGALAGAVEAVERPAVFPDHELGVEPHRGPRGRQPLQHAERDRDCVADPTGGLDQRGIAMQLPQRAAEQGDHRRTGRAARAMGRVVRSRCVRATAQRQQHFRRLRVGDEIHWTLGIARLSDYDHLTRQGVGRKYQMLYQFFNQNDELLCNQTFDVLVYRAPMSTRRLYAG